MTRVDKNNCNKDFVFYVMRGKKFNNRIDWIDLSELPKLKKGSNEAIDWNLVKGYKVLFSFDNNLNYLEIISNKNEKRQVQILLSGIKGMIYDANLKKIKLSTFIPNQKVNYKYQYDIGDIVSFNETNFKILSQRRIDNKTGYLVECLACGYIHEKRQSSLDLKRECACCSCRIVVKGINNASHLYPHINQFLVNKEDGENLTPYDVHKPVKTKCPNCGYVNDKSRMVKLCKDFKCTQCMSGSRAERIVTNILKNGKYNFESQFIVGDYRYDYYIPFLNMLLEVDGEQHRVEVKHFKISLKEQQLIDYKKEQLAHSLGYTFKRIDIDTYESIESIIKKLSFLEFDKTNIYNYLLDTEFVQFVELYNQGFLMKNIKKILNTHKKRVSHMAELASSLNLIVYNKEDSKYRHSIRKIKCVTTGQIFNTITDAEKFYNLSQGNVGKVCRGKANYAGRHPDTNEPLQWEFIN